MFLRFKEEEVAGYPVFTTLNLQHCWQVTRSKWGSGWSIRLEMARGHFALVAKELTNNEVEEVEAKIIEGMMSKEEGVLEIT